MTAAEAHDTAAEQVRWWRANGWTPEIAWQALTGEEATRVTWDDALLYMIGWLMATDAVTDAIRRRLLAALDDTNALPLAA